MGQIQSIFSNRSASPYTGGTTSRWPLAYAILSVQAEHCEGRDRPNCLARHAPRTSPKPRHWITP